MIRVGMKLFGYCEGTFGRDSYGTKRVEAFGDDWVVVREEGGGVNFAEFKSFEDLQEKLLGYNKSFPDEESL